MIIIAHRGKYTPSSKDNTVLSATELLAVKCDVELDVWFLSSGRFQLGHEYNDSAIDFLPAKWIKNKHVWLHAKTPRTLYELLKLKAANCFYIDDLHQCVLTSSGYIWTSPNGKLTPKSIAVMPELSTWTEFELQSVAGICTDDPLKYQALF